MAIDSKRFEIISKALGDANRIKILIATKDQGWLQCSNILDLIDLSQPAISHHTKILVEAGLLLPEKHGRNYRYSLNKALISEYHEFLNVIAI